MLAHPLQKVQVFANIFPLVKVMIQDVAPQLHPELCIKPLQNSGSG